MNLNTVRNIIFFVILLVAQMLVLNHIHLFGYATPLLYVYFALTLRRGTPRWAVLLWCFAMGLAVDIFSSTPGVASASMTFVGLIQPYVLTLFAPRDSADDLRPSPLTLGVSKYVNYMIIIVLLYTLSFFSLEAFNLYNWTQWALCTVSSAVLTIVLILVIENIRRKR